MIEKLTSARPLNYLEELKALLNSAGYNNLFDMATTLEAPESVLVVN